MKNRKWDSSFRQLQLHSPLQWQFFITLPYSICYEETAVWSSWPNWALSEEEMSCFWCVHRVPLCSFESLPHSGLLRGPWARGSRVHPTHKHGPGVRESLKRILKKKIPLEIWMGKNKTRGEKGGGGPESFPVIAGSLFLVWREGLEVRAVEDVWTERGWKGAMAEIPRGSSTRLEEASEANLSLAC